MEKNKNDDVAKANEKGENKMNKIIQAIEVLNNEGPLIWLGNYVYTNDIINLFTMFLEVEAYSTHREDTILLYAEDVPFLQELYPEDKFPGGYLLLYDYYIKGVPNLLILQKNFHKLSKAEKQFCYWHELGHAATFSEHASPMLLEYMADEYAIKKLGTRKGALRLFTRFILMFLHNGKVRATLHARIKNVKEVSITDEKILS